MFRTRKPDGGSRDDGESKISEDMLVVVDQAVNLSFHDHPSP